MALMDIVRVGKALQEIAAVMKNEPTIITLSVTLPKTRLSRDDIDYLAFMATRELACRVMYEWNDGKPEVIIKREEEK